MSLAPAMHPGPLRTAMLEVCRVHGEIDRRGYTVAQLRELAPRDDDAAALLSRYESAVAARRAASGRE